MKALVVYESVFGNTQLIAEAVGRGLGESAEVAVLEVSSAPTTGLDVYDLIVVGGPIHAFTMTRATGRRDAARQANQTSITGERGLREWFSDIPRIGQVPAASFDTRAERIFGVIPVGSASKPIASKLRKRGCRIVAFSEAFYVSGKEGPLEEGEVDRAVEWGRNLAALVGASAAA